MGRSDPLTPSHHEQIRNECQQLVGNGVSSADAKRMLAERWDKSEVHMRSICKGIGTTFQPKPLDAIGGEMSVGKYDFRPLPEPPTRFPNIADLPIRETRQVRESLPSLDRSGFIPPELDYVPHTKLDLENIAEPAKLEGVKTYIITGWEIRVKPDYKFLDCLRQIAKEYDAEIYLAPCYLPDLDFLPNELRTTCKLLTEDLELNDNIFFKYVSTHALAVSPLSGWKGFSDKTAIIPGLIKELETLPTDKDCKQLITTGSCGYMTLDSEHYRFIKESQDKDYKKRFDARWNSSRSQKRPIAIASEYVMPSAQIVHVVNDKIFLMRRVSMQQGKDHIFDLNKKYTAGKKSPQIISPLFVNVGDTHAWFADNSAIRATFEQLIFLKPQNIILNDFCDGVSVNYHEKDRAFTFHQAPPIATEIEYTKWLLRAFKEKAGSAKLIYRHSNHDDFAIKLLDSGEKYWRMNYNYDICVRLQKERKDTGLHPIQLLIDFERLGIEFSPDAHPLMLGGITVIHGHEPVSGRRAGFKELVKNYNRVSMGHGHSPKEWRNGVMGGLTAIRNMSYTEGSLNGMLHANTIGHEDGSMQLITMIGGMWKV